MNEGVEVPAEPFWIIWPFYFSIKVGTENWATYFAA